jgi:hypothetical protein
VVLNAAGTLITVDGTWSGLGTKADVAGIHGPGGAPTNAPIIFTFHGVPKNTSGSIPSQGYTITPQQLAWLTAGYLYIDITTATYPNGEIRGQILPVLVPEPGSLALLSLGVGALVWRFRRR